MQIGTLKLLRTGLACLFFASLLVLALILKIKPTFAGSEIADGTGLVVTSVVAVASFVAWMVAALAVARKNRDEST